MSNLVRLTLVAAVAASLPLTGAAAREGHGGQAGRDHGPAHATARDGTTSDRAAGRDAPSATTRGRVSATATTVAFAGRHRAAADAAADAVARGPRTVTRTLTETFAVATGRFRAAVAVAEAVARSFLGGKAAARGSGKSLGGVPSPVALVSKAIASAKAEAIARGPRTLTDTFTDSFTKVGPSSATAAAISVSVALSARGRPALAAAEDRLAREAGAVDRGERTDGAGTHRDEAGSGPEAADRGEACEPCRGGDRARLSALY